MLIYVVYIDKLYHTLVDFSQQLLYNIYVINNERKNQMNKNNIYKLYITTDDKFKTQETIYLLPSALLRAIEISKCDNVLNVDVCDKNGAIIIIAKHNNYEIVDSVNAEQITKIIEVYDNKKGNK